MFSDIEGIDSDSIYWTINGTNVPTSLNIKAVREVVSFLQWGVQPIQQLLNAIRAMSGFFYPVDSLKTGPLHYYQQREWRIVSGGVAASGPLSRDLSDAEKESLLEINPAFWKREEEFRTGKHRRIDQSQVIDKLAGVPIVSTARRIIAPSNQIDNVLEVLAATGCTLKVTALEELS